MGRLILGVMLMCAAVGAEAADLSLIIGTAQVTLGMSRVQAWELLKQHDIRCTGQEKKVQPLECDSWFVSLRKPKGPQFTAVGSLNFSKDGRIKSIFKYYDQREWGAKPEKFISFLYEVLRQYGEKGETFTASIGEVRQPGWISKAIYFRSGRKTISVTYGEGGAYGTRVNPFITLQEYLE